MSSQTNGINSLFPSNYGYGFARNTSGCYWTCQHGFSINWCNPVRASTIAVNPASNGGNCSYDLCMMQQIACPCSASGSFPSWDTSTGKRTLCYCNYSLYNYVGGGMGDNLSSGCECVAGLTALPSTPFKTRVQAQGICGFAGNYFLHRSGYNYGYNNYFQPYGCTSVASGRNFECAACWLSCNGYAGVTINWYYGVCYWKNESNCNYRFRTAMSTCLPTSCGTYWGQTTRCNKESNVYATQTMGYACRCCSQGFACPGQWPPAVSSHCCQLNTSCPGVGCRKFCCNYGPCAWSTCYPNSMAACSYRTCITCCGVTARVGMECLAAKFVVHHAGCCLTCTIYPVWYQVDCRGTTCLLATSVGSGTLACDVQFCHYCCSWKLCDGGYFPLYGNQKNIMGLMFLLTNNGNCITNSSCRVCMRLMQAYFGALEQTSCG